MWIRNDLQTHHHRLLRLKAAVRTRKIKPTDAQIQALERSDPGCQAWHIQLNARGEILAVDTLFAGTRKGMARVYIQTVLNCLIRFVWARPYTSKMPVTAVQFLNNHVLPFFNPQAPKVRTIFRDNGRQYPSRPDKHPYELFLQLEEIEPPTTKVRMPQSTGFIDRFQLTLIEDHLRINGPTTWYAILHEIQKDLDAYLDTYNTCRTATRPQDGKDGDRQGVQDGDLAHGLSPEPKDTGQKRGDASRLDPHLSEVECRGNTVVYRRVCYTSVPIR